MFRVIDVDHRGGRTNQVSGKHGAAEYVQNTYLFSYEGAVYQFYELDAEICRGSRWKWKKRHREPPN